MGKNSHPLPKVFPVHPSADGPCHDPACSHRTNGAGTGVGVSLPLVSSTLLPPGATRDIGSALTRMCMRHRSIEAKLRQFTK